ncbi:alpha,alpha-trehalose-phosphate synthase (UDP-forming) [Solimonas terrae]|uniref:Trehalose-6-phosphate synthase n=1 Tax=Solimonas terrae TaxID=1396819 RepID=A0A6M2BT16_9GAMM|nr:alpha,alpha-trehalose-phosphate synthase (UDP-forming) [Solimonas terrae]NGY05107.1 alpha,alpha-trehalose-phosphate synthase (UDP-forming) [Solimonas terrae]
MSRLVAVSNRVGSLRGATRAGGLAVALAEALQTRRGLWFGWSGEVVEQSADQVRRQTAGGVTRATVDLTTVEHDDYYNGFANACLWPLFHYRLDLTSFDRRFYDSYQRVNRRFAHALIPLLRDDDLVWVHDYHLLPFGDMLRDAGCEQKLGFFLHIPFPVREVFTTLPMHDRLARALMAYDLIGFQTDGDVQRFRDYVLREAGGRRDGDTLTAYGRTVTVKAFPIGIDAEQFAEMAASDEAGRDAARLKAAIFNRVQIIGVDRLDYTKGIPERFHAYQTLLENYPDTHGQISFLQIAPTSRGEVPEYIHLRHELETLAGHINGRFAQLDWTPLRYINRAITRRQLAGLYRMSRIGFVTPLRDGMNLVAKEYVAAQDPDDPGVLVLSRFAGSVKQMPAALIVNPYDTAGVAETLQKARHMPLAERCARYQELMKGLIENNVGKWSDDFVGTLERLGAEMALA